MNVISPTQIQLYTAPVGSSSASLVAVNSKDAGTLTNSSISLAGSSYTLPA